MSKIKLTIDETEYQITYMMTSDFSITQIPKVIVNGICYLTKTIQKEVKKDYKIMSFYCEGSIYKDHITKRVDGSEDCFYGGGTENYHLQKHIIHSVLRLSDGEIFCIGDKTQYGKIKGFEIKEDRLRVTYYAVGDWQFLQSIKKVNPVILTTEEGIAVYEPSQTIYLAQQGHIRNSFIVFSTNAASCHNQPDAKYFHSKINRDQFVKDNTPKQKLFTTEDGVGIFVGDEVFTVRKNDYYLDGKSFKAHAGSISLELNKKHNQYWYFSTVEKASEWLINNKAVPISFNDINKIIKAACSISGYETVQNVTCEIKDFFKSKINP